MAHATLLDGKAVGRWDKLSTHAPKIMLVINLGGVDSSAMSKTRAMDCMLAKRAGPLEVALAASLGHAITIKHAKRQVGPLVG